MSSFKKYDLNEFQNYIEKVKLLRKINKIQLHHTYSPSYNEFSGNNHIALQEGMRNCHIKNNGWSDIAQHFTIFPDGIIVAGRSLEMVPAGIKGANTGAIAIECIGNFDIGEDAMDKKQKEAIVGVLKVLTKKFSIEPKEGIIYHAWWTSGGKNLGDYIKGQSCKTCPGTNFFGGNTKKAFEENLLPLICEGANPLKSVDEINDIVWELINAGIVTDGKLWLSKCKEDKNIYHLCRKMANYLRGTL